MSAVEAGGGPAEMAAYADALDRWRADQDGPRMGHQAEQGAGLPHVTGARVSAYHGPADSAPTLPTSYGPGWDRVPGRYPAAMRSAATGEVRELRTGDVLPDGTVWPAGTGDPIDQVEAASGPGGPTELTGNPVIAELVHALRVLGCGHRDQAVAVVNASPAELTWRERAAILAAFPAVLVDPVVPLDPDWHDMRTGAERDQAEEVARVEEDAAERASIEAEAAAELAAAANVDLTRYRWADHKTDRGTWCRWSHVNVSARVARSDDQRCPAECSTSSIEVDPDPERDPWG